MLTPDFSNITNAYSIRAPINTTYTECGERCFVQIPVSKISKLRTAEAANTNKGFGFDVNCTKVESDLDFGTTPDANGSLTAKETDAFTSNVILGYDITGSGNQGYTNARIQLFTSTTPDGKILRNNTCHMYASLVAYDVQLAEGEATLRSSDYRTDRVISRMFVCHSIFYSLPNILQNSGNASTPRWLRSCRSEHVPVNSNIQLQRRSLKLVFHRFTSQSLSCWTQCNRPKLPQNGLE